MIPAISKLSVTSAAFTISLAIVGCALVLMPESPAAAQTVEQLMKAGLDAYCSYQYQRSVENYNKAISLSPDCFECYFRRGGAYHLLDQNQRAIEDYDRALSLNPNYAWSYSGRGYAENSLKQYQRAIEDFDKAISLNSDDFGAYDGRAEAYSGLKQYQRAVDDYNKYMSLNPPYFVDYDDRGKAYTGLKQYQRAIEDFDKAISEKPICFACYRDRGYAYTGLKQYQRAIEDFDKAISLYADDAACYSGRGTAHVQTGQYQRSIEDFDKAVSLAPNDAAAANGRGYAYIGLKQYQRAIEIFDKAISLDPRSAADYTGRGAAYNELKQFQRAIEDFDKAISLAPGETAAYYNRGVAYICLKQYQSAFEDFDKAASLDASDPVACSNRGWALLALHKAEEAVDSFNKAIARRSTPSSWDYAGLSTAYTLTGLSELASRNEEKAKGCADYAEQTPEIKRRQILAISNLTGSGSQKPAVAGGINRPITDKWALVVGISKFKHADYNLKYAAKDAQDFYNYLVNEAGFKKDHVVLLLNENATRENIMRAFGSKFLPAVSEPDDLVVVFVSTHGTPSRMDPSHKNYIVAYNTDKDDPYVTGVDMDELNRRLKEGVKSDRALIIMDTCYSGAGVPGAKGLQRAANFSADEIAQGCGHLVISSSSPDERSWESPVTQNGVFTKYFLESLRSNNHKVTVLTAFNTARDRVAWEVKSAYKVSQTPQLGGDWQGKDLILYVPATSPRTIFDKDLLDLMQSWAASTVSPAPEANHDYSKSQGKNIHKGK